MELFESSWFFSMVEKRGSTPKQRLLAVFTIAAEWIAAPGLREKFSLETVNDTSSSQQFQHLTAFLNRLSVSAKARNPAMLSNQLALLLIGAIAEQLRHPEMQVLEEAADAAQVLVSSACTRTFNIRFGYGTGLAASVLAVFIGWHLLTQPVMPVAAAPQVAIYHNIMPVAAVRQVNPDEVEAVLALHEQILRGECNAPHLAMLPPDQTTAYMNVIESRQPDDPAADEASLRAFMAWYNSIHAIECYPPHTNDHINTVWVRKKVG
ncbi:MAG TPA: hypothetical protein VIE17_05155 [Methylophilaceae bacterium]